MHGHGREFDASFFYRGYGGGGGCSLHASSVAVFVFGFGSIFRGGLEDCKSHDGVDWWKDLGQGWSILNNGRNTYFWVSRTM